MIPGDIRVLSSKDLFVSQGSLTGESLPVEKFHDVETKAVASPTEFKNICFMGTSVRAVQRLQSWSQRGCKTYFGSMADLSRGKGSRPVSIWASTVSPG